MRVLSGRFGPYVTDGETNATLKKGMDPLSITAEQASELLSKKREAGPSTGRVARKAPTRKAPFQKAAAKTATAKSGAKKSGAKTSTKPAAKKKK